MLGRFLDVITPPWYHRIRLVSTLFQRVLNWIRRLMGNLTERQKLILALVIRDYIEETKPVGSVRLVKHYGLGFSSATVRNEMMALTEKGY
ncbi:MAG: hypothetical protein KAJ53_00870, partial [Anaerolineales bacterium]|nr:hypothetical protein [Anaerolineales bacterium]